MIRVMSYGGGVQSTAMVIMAAHGELDGGPYDAALMSNVGDDSEHPATLAYVRGIAIPWAEAVGFPIHLLQRHKRDGTTETLYGRLTKPGSRSLPIPVRMDNGAPGTRNCTHDFKIQVVRKWLKANGASADNPARVAIGISTDEIQRLHNKKTEPYEQPYYPLIEMGMSRLDCMRRIEAEGLPVPPKSACYFCPFHRPAMWADMARDEPELFNKAADLEDLLNRRRDELGKDHVYLTRFARPIRDAIGPAQDMLPIFAPDTDSCDDGYCWT